MTEIRRCAVLLALMLAFTWGDCMPLSFAQHNAAGGDVDADFALQGEYTGTITGPGGDQKVGVQVIALGGGSFRAVSYFGGLPGDGWQGGETESMEAKKADDGSVTFNNDHAQGRLKDGQLELSAADGSTSFGSLQKTHRKSPTLGKAPPEGAIVLFDGTSADNFVSPKGGPARVSEEGFLMQGANSRQKFGSCHLHIEFCLPYQPDARGQRRGNSGCYLQGRYEVQMLDSFGLSGEHNECGGIYSIRKPDINMCFPPLSWQTYDIDFVAAKFDENGSKTANARMTVRHNGVLIHDDIDLPKTTTAAPVEDNHEKGYLHLQDHGNPVRYRNIWLIEK